jgi:hypothetical protein
MPSVDPTNGKIVHEATVLVDGVECLPKFNPEKRTSEAKQQHPLWRTSSNLVGFKAPTVHDVPTTYRYNNPTSRSPAQLVACVRERRASSAGVHLRPGGCTHAFCVSTRPTSQAFSNTFSIGESTNKRTVMFKDNGLSCSV